MDKVEQTMKNQHLQTAVLPAEVATAMRSHETTQRAIAELQEFIALRPNAREVRKALVLCDRNNQTV
jgi:putative transposase